MTTTTVVRRHVLLQLQHHDPASLLAGKLHAVLQRPYPKGRDYYDLIWYLADPSWPEPNSTMLNEALRQTDWSGGDLTAGTWREAVASCVAEVAWEQIVDDARPLLEPAEEVSLLRRDTLLGLLR